MYIHNMSAVYLDPSFFTSTVTRRLVVSLSVQSVLPNGPAWYRRLSITSSVAPSKISKGSQSQTVTYPSVR